MSRPNWSLPLPRQIIIPKVMTLKTLADVRKLIRHLPKGRLNRPIWHYVASELAFAAAGTDPAGVAIALRIVLSIEGVECRSQ